MEKVSIIIPVYNTEKYLEACLNSVVNQTYSNVEILIIDDGSTDESSLIYNKFLERDKRIRVIKEKHKGVSNARNIGIEESTGEYLLFVDSDDWIDKSLVKSVLESYKSYKPDIVIYSINNSDKLNYKYKEGIYKIDDIINYLITSEKINSPCNKIYNKKLIGNVRFDKRIKIGEDLLFNINYFKNVSRVYLSQKALYNYVIHENSATRSYNKGKYNELMYVNSKLSEWIKNSNYTSKRLKNVCNYIRLKNIISCFKDLKNKQCDYSKYEKYQYIKMIKQQNKRIIVYSIDFKIFIISIVYTIIPSKILSYIF